MNFSATWRPSLRSRPIDHAHTTAPEFAEDAVMGNLLTDHESVTTLLGGNVRPRTESGQLASRLAWLKGGRRVAHVLPLWAVARKIPLLGPPRPYVRCARSRPRFE